MIEQFASFEHGVHYDRQLSRHCDSSPFEPGALSELQAPDTQSAVRRRPREDHHGRFVQQSAQMIVTAPGDVTSIINFTRLVAPGGQADPGTDRARLGKVGRILNRGNKRRSCHYADTGYRHEQLALLARASRGDKLLVQLSDTRAYG